MRRFIWLALCGLAFAQAPGGPVPGIGQGSVLLIPVPVSQLANYAYFGRGTIVPVSDGNSSSDCTTGGGTTAVTCQYSGSVWAALAGGGGSGTVGSCATTGAVAIYTAATTTGCGNHDLTYATHTYTGTSGLILDLSAGPATTGLKLPSAAGAAPTADGQSAFDTTAHLPVWGSNTTTVTVPTSKTNPGHNFLTTYTQTSGAFGQAQPACGDLSDSGTGCSTTVGTFAAQNYATPPAIGGSTPAAGSFTTLTGTTFNTTTRCAAAGSGANPSLVACSAAPAGFFSCATNASAGTCVVSTSAVTANSVIQIQPDSTLGTALSVTCNTSADTGVTAPRVSARSASTSFTITLGTFTTNPECFSYLIIN
jgi:hypothetical protein